MNLSNYYFYRLLKGGYWVKTDNKWEHYITSLEAPPKNSNSKIEDHVR